MYKNNSPSEENEQKLSLRFTPLCRIDFISVPVRTIPATYLSKIMKWTKVLFSICFVLVFFTVVARMYVWYILNPPRLTPGTYPCYFLMVLIFKTFKYFGIIMFFFTWGLTAYWYIFFKCQYRPYVFFPDLFESYWNHYRKFDILWGLACGSYGLYMLYRIYNQINCDVFFIDWEHDKDILETVMGKTMNKPYKSPWRSIHIVNQYNLLQKTRTISIPFCFIIFIMCYYSKHILWKHHTQLSPNVSFAETSLENYLLTHFLGTSIIFIVGLAQWFIRRVIQPWVPTPTTEFLDLCSVANVSVLILQESLSGYYVHGQSPLGKADVTLQELIRFLEEEGRGKIKGRGITDDKKNPAKIDIGSDATNVANTKYLLNTSVTTETKKTEAKETKITKKDIEETKDILKEESSYMQDAANEVTEDLDDIDAKDLGNDIYKVDAVDNDDMEVPETKKIELIEEKDYLNFKTIFSLVGVVLFITLIIVYEILTMRFIRKKPLGSIKK